MERRDVESRDSSVESWDLEEGFIPSISLYCLKSTRVQRWKTCTSFEWREQVRCIDWFDSMFSALLICSGETIVESNIRIYQSSIWLSQSFCSLHPVPSNSSGWLSGLSITSQASQGTRSPARLSFPRGVCFGAQWWKSGSGGQRTLSYIHFHAS